MTDKEPFAEAEKPLAGTKAHVLIGPVAFPADTEARAELLCERINAYFEDRVKERLEEFRERAIRACIGAGNRLCAEDYVNKIREIPTEPEK